MQLKSSITPAMRYQRCLEAIDWLCDVLGFEKVVVYHSEETVHHALLRLGSGMIMVSSSGKSEFDQYSKTPAEAGNINTQSAYICVDSIEDHYQNVFEKGVEIVLPLTKEAHGTGYTCKDPEGYLWSFGDYDPWSHLEQYSPDE